MSGDALREQIARWLRSKFGEDHPTLPLEDWMLGADELLAVLGLVPDARAEDECWLCEHAVVRSLCSECGCLAHYHRPTTAGEAMRKVLVRAAEGLQAAARGADAAGHGESAGVLRNAAENVVRTPYKDLEAAALHAAAGRGGETPPGEDIEARLRDSLAHRAEQAPTSIEGEAP